MPTTTPPHHPWLTPRNLLWASVAVALVTIALKTLAWYVTGSVGLLSDAMESFVNLASAVFALAMVTIAQWPADENHPYGHHKAEYFSSGFEGILIVGVSLGILWAAGHRLFAPQPLEQVGWGLALSVASSVLNGVLAWLMLRSSRVHQSIALEADARHLFTDVWTSAGVLVGITAAALTGWLWLDAAAAIAVGLNILREGVSLVWRSSQGLMDEAAEPEVQAAIEATLQRFAQAQVPGAVRFDHVSTRRAGQRQFASLHLHVPANWTLGQAARLRGQVERALVAAVPGLRATIELLPNDVEALFHEPETEDVTT
ncbi:cation diffusion facilitator family transporter [Acidovorax soli]|uniref:Cation diffusion facilitator family transporter n=1 Tax=Acidovorax soli TaxID=592050 RepID=A0A7X0PFU2_9BURK|nr:cation diffusion facilitator family transporter [Acidovorax soli]MBB6560676.1 cation diffusion facilitator family transporter [Acidovorax soli]